MKATCSFCGGSGAIHTTPHPSGAHDPLYGKTSTCANCHGSGYTGFADKKSTARGNSFSSFPRKERRRRKAKLHAFVRSVSIGESFKGLVSTYLREDGTPLVDDDGDFTIEESVRYGEHLRRLDLFYCQMYQFRIDSISANETDLLDKAMRWEAVQRLKLQEEGKYMCSINRTGFEVNDSWFKEKKKLFGKKIVEANKWQVNLKTYEKRCRLRVSQLFGIGKGYHSFTIHGIEAADQPALESLLYFVNTPSTSYEPLPKDYDFG